MPEIDNAGGAVSATEQAEKRTEETHRLVSALLSPVLATGIRDNKWQRYRGQVNPTRPKDAMPRSCAYIQ